MKKIIAILPEITREEAIKEMLEGRTVVNSTYDDNIYYHYYNANNKNYPFRTINIETGQNRPLDFNTEKWCRCLLKNTEELRKGDKVLVRSNADTEWNRRYFSHEEHGIYFCFLDGKTEWTSGRKTASWVFCEKWKGE